MSSHKRMTYSADAANYLEKEVSLEEVLKEIMEVEAELLEKYATYLEASGTKSKANGLTFGNESVERYRKRFLYNVLMCSYRVFDASHKRYPELLEAVEKNNPEWLEAIKKDHANKLSICKVDVYPLVDEKIA